MFLNSVVWCVASSLTFDLGWGHCFRMSSSVDLCRICIGYCHCTGRWMVFGDTHRKDSGASGYIQPLQWQLFYKTQILLLRLGEQTKDQFNLLARAIPVEAKIICHGNIWGRPKLFYGSLFTVNPTICFFLHITNFSIDINTNIAILVLQSPHQILSCITC